jgi:hypothetical protein
VYAPNTTKAAVKPYHREIGLCRSCCREAKHLSFVCLMIGPFFDPGRKSPSVTITVMLDTDASAEVA